MLERRVCSAPGANFGMRAPATTLVILVTCIVTAMQVLLAALSSRRDLQALLAINPRWFSENEWWRPLTANLVHSHGLPHLLLNMSGLALAGPPVERFVGPSRFVGVYVASGVLALSAEAAGGSWVSGASGAVVGVFATLFVHAIDGSPSSRSTRQLRRLAIGLSALWLLSGPLLSFLVGMAIANTAHVVGFITGLVLGIATYCERGRRPR